MAEPLGEMGPEERRGVKRGLQRGIRIVKYYTKFGQTKKEIKKVLQILQEELDKFPDEREAQRQQWQKDFARERAGILKGKSK